MPVKLDSITCDELRRSGRRLRGEGVIRSLEDAQRRMGYLDAAFQGVAGHQHHRVGDRRRRGQRGRRGRSPGTAHLVVPAVPTITMLPESEPQQGFVEGADFRAIFAHLEPAQPLAASIPSEAAWRIRSVVLTLEWARVDLAEG